MTPQQLENQRTKYGLVVELDQNGTILRSIHDPSGQTFDAVSEVREASNGDLYIAASNRNYIGKVRAADLPSIMPLDPSGKNKSEI
jgi:hypothetical protein